MLLQAEGLTGAETPVPSSATPDLLVAPLRDTRGLIEVSVDAGATFCNDPEGKDGAWTQFLKTAEEQKKIKVVYVTEPITGDTMTTTNKFYASNKNVVEKTVKLLEGMGKSEEGKKILAALYRIDAMVPAKSSDYDPVRAAAKTLKIE